MITTGNFPIALVSGAKKKEKTGTPLASYFKGKTSRLMRAMIAQYGQKEGMRRYKVKTQIKKSSRSLYPGPIRMN